MIAIGFPKSPRKRIAFLVLGLLVFAWVLNLSLEMGIEILLRQKGASVWRNSGRADGLSFSKGSSFGNEDMALVTWLGGMSSLDIVGTQVDSAGLEQVRGCRYLTRLTVLVEQITPEQEHRFTRERRLLTIHKTGAVDR